VNDQLEGSRGMSCYAVSQCNYLSILSVDRSCAYITPAKCVKVPVFILFPETQKPLL
jgi:hypothetical protein